MQESQFLLRWHLSHLWHATPHIQSDFFAITTKNNQAPHDQAKSCGPAPLNLKCISYPISKETLLVNLATGNIQVEIHWRSWR